MSRTTFVINSLFMGQGDDELGEKLLGSLLRKVWSLDDPPEKILFYNSGVKLLSKGSPVLDALEGLAAKGVELVACGTCVAHFGLRDSIAVGRVGDMGEIVHAMTAQAKAVTI